LGASLPANGVEGPLVVQAASAMAAAAARPPDEMVRKSFI
jgi:hypothetical protein